MYRRKVQNSSVSWLLFIAIVSSIFQINPQSAFAVDSPSKLKDADSGKIISFGGINWILLDPETGYAIARDSQGQRAIDDDSSSAFDPSDTSNIAYWLNYADDSFMNTLIDGSANPAWILKHNWTTGYYDHEDESYVDNLKIGLIGVTEYYTYEGILNSFGLYDYWTRTYSGGKPRLAYAINIDGIGTAPTTQYASDAFNVLPTLYLDPELTIASGEGSEDLPYEFADPTDPASSTLTVSQPTVTADGISSSTVTVKLNGLLHTVSGHEVSLLKDYGSSVITAVYGKTNADGEAVFEVSNTKAEAVTYTAVDTTDNVTLTETAQITFVPGSASAGDSTLTALPARVAADGSASSTLTVTIKDAFDNPIPGHEVSISKDGGSSVITAVYGKTNADGQAVFEVSNTKVEAVTYTAARRMA